MSQRSEISSIDDLLGGVRDDEAVAPEPRRRWRPGRVWGSTLLFAAAGTAVAALALRAFDLTASYPVIFSAFVALALLRLAVLAIGMPPRAERQRQRLGSGEEDGTYNWAGRDGLRRAVGRWERDLDWSNQNSERYRRLVVPALRQLADERLRQRHGVTIASDQRRARELLGEELWTFLTAPPKRPPKPRQFALLVTSLEEL